MADRQKKLVFAGVLLVVGVGGAMLFRRSPIAREFPEPEFTGRVLQAIDPSLSLPIPPLPPDSLAAEPVAATPVPSETGPARSPTPHLLGSIELTESPAQGKPVAAAATRTERPVFELPEPAGANAVANSAASAKRSTHAPQVPPPAKVFPVSSMPSVVSAGEVAGSHLRSHQVQEGETLSSLARRYLGAADRYPELFAANRDVLQSPDRLPVGVTLKVPTSSFDVESQSSTLPAAPIVPIPPGAWRRGQH